MKSFKKVLLLFIAAFLLILPIGSKVVNAKDKKVKVYIFEAGGCPFCEEQKKFLKSLDSYGEKFEIVVKELYVDHINWEHGADYKIGKKVAIAFKDIGFDEAMYEATPLVIISDLYAASAYSEDLEQYINKAYEEGDKDVVGCFESGKSNCLASDEDKNEKEEIKKYTDTEKDEDQDSNSFTSWVINLWINLLNVNF